LTATNGRSLRGDRTWIARATSSLPVPDSPVISTVLLVAAMVSTSSNTASIGGLLPMMLENWCELWSARLSSTFSCCRRRRSSSFFTRRRRSATAFGDLCT
jgi:hypothetical protein